MNIEKEQLESIVKHYVLDQLSEQDAAEFEAFFLSRPDVADMIDSAQKIKIGLESIQAEADSISDYPVVRKESLLVRLGQLIAGPAPSFAMLAILAVCVPLAIKGVSQNDNTSLSAELVRIDSGVQRSAGDNNGINLDVNGDYAALIVRVRDVEYPEYQMMIRSADSHKELWRSQSFAFASGSRDYLLLVPPHAAIDNVAVKLYGITEDGDEVIVDYCNYTESCL